VSLPCLHGEAKTAKVGSVTRVPATDIEDVIVESVTEHLRRERRTEDLGIRNHSAIAEVIDRIDVYRDQLEVRLISRETPGTIKLPEGIEPWRSPPLHPLAKAAVEKDSDAWVESEAVAHAQKSRHCRDAAEVCPCATKPERQSLEPYPPGTGFLDAETEPTKSRLETRPFDGCLTRIQKRA
jgi:hypothetical protein